MNEDLAITRIVIVEDHGIVRAAIKRALSQISWIDVVGEAEDGVTAIHVISCLKPDLVILDLLLPGVEGVEIIPIVRRRSPGSRIIVLTGMHDGAVMKRAFSLGVDAYVLKSGGWPELERAMVDVVAGGQYVSPAASLFLDSGIGCGAVVPRLTGRERQVLKLLAEGHTNQKIAAILGISVKTVDRHRENMMIKLGVRTPVALAAIALREGLVV
ncbi:MAG: response regulator transcription factor [Rhodospirillales bacterium]|nr:MAG: response regulator transcription factor [Rhodospirillales bacterium]